MDNVKSCSDLRFRFALLERAAAENARKIDELARTIGSDREIAAEPPPQRIIVDADSIAPFAAGFHFREFDATGKAYRWTGRGDFFEIRVRIKRDIEWTFDMDLRGNEHVSVASLQAFVDYVEIPIELSGPDSYVLGRLPAKPLSDTAVLTFYLPDSFIPSQLDPSSSDHRTLGAVFYGLQLHPTSP